MDRSKLISQLRIDEEEVLHVYQDSLGFWTLGVGRMVDPKKGGGISKEESAYLLNNDIIKVEADLDLFVPWWRNLSENRQLVLANMCFNMGISTLLTFKNTLKAMSEGQYDVAAEGMRESKWARQVGKRAVRLIKLMEEG